MGEITNTAIAIMSAFFLVVLFSNAMLSASDDATEQAFTPYSQYKNWSELNEENLTHTNTNSSVSNMQIAAETISNKIAEAQSQLNSDNVAEQILGAFGVAAALTIDVVFLLLAVLLDGVNFVAGTLFYLSALESPFNYFAVLGAFLVAMFIVTMVFRIASVIVKWDI